jgi:hypothetical protein
MGIGFYAARNIDRHDLYIGAVFFYYGAHHIAPDPAKSIYAQTNCHLLIL